MRLLSPIFQRFAQCLVAVAMFAGCAAPGEVPLWPILDVERPNPTGGAHVEVLWPMFEYDNSTAAPSYAVRPIISYDYGARTGTYLWPFGSFGRGTHPHAGFWPVYSWRGWNAEEKTGRHVLFPIGGYWHTPDRNWLVGPGLYYRHRSAGEAETKTDAMLVPPIWYSRGPERSTFLLANFYATRTPTLRERVLFPIVWWQETGPTEEPTSIHRELFPVFGWSQRREHGVVRATRMRLLWPLLSVGWGPDAGWNQALLYLLSWRYHDGELTHLNMLPFFSDGPTHMSLPFLGFCAWDTHERPSAHLDWRRGWASWPFVGHQQEYRDRAASASDVLRAAPESDLTGERWWYLAGLVSHHHRPGELEERLVWPLYHSKVELQAPDELEAHASRAPDTPVVDAPRAEPQVTRRVHAYLGGLVRHETRPLADYERLDPLFPLIMWERGPDAHAHRFWPLYRYSAGSHSTHFRALVELLRIDHDTTSRSLPEVVLQPFSYWSAANGDYWLRLVWKLFESRRVGEESRWALHPLLFSKRTPTEREFLFLGGLWGSIRRGESHATRLLWLFEI